MSKLKGKLEQLSKSVSMGGLGGAAPPGSAFQAHVGAPPAQKATAPEPEEPLSDERGSRIAQLRARMQQLGEKLARPRPPEASVRSPLAAFDADALAGPPALIDAPQLESLPGETVEGRDGPLRRVHTRFDEDHCHGCIPVSSALSAHAHDIAVLALDPTLREVDFSRALYIDTETTGLSGGSGTLPFLIGMAWFEDRALCVEQLLLTRPGLEAPMLHRLAERLAQASAVVSFNGKSFDWPLLRTRFVLTRVAAPVLPPHLDLLHCARRVYKRRLGSVRLVHLEEAILGFTRVDDIPGELIPPTYLNFLRGQAKGAALAPIIDHNRSDLVALAAILGELARRFRGEAPEQDARDQLGFAGVAARADDGARALAFAKAAVDADLRGELSVEAHYLAGELGLRARDYVAAERAFLLSVEAACGVESRAARAHLALSKLYEHRLRRFADALAHARRACLLEGEEANRRRIARLEQKSRLTELAIDA